MVTTTSVTNRESEQKATGQSKALSISKVSFTHASEKDLTSVALKALNQGKIPSQLPASYEKVALLRILPKDPNKEGIQKEGILCALFKEKLEETAFDSYYLYDCSLLEKETEAKESAAMTLRKSVFPKDTGEGDEQHAMIVTRVDNLTLKNYRAGTTLMQLAIEISIARDLNGRVELESLKDSEAFYEKLGFKSAPYGLGLQNCYMHLFTPEIALWKKRIAAHRILPMITTTSVTNRESEHKETGQSKALSISKVSFTHASEKDLTSSALKRISSQMPSSSYQRIALLRILPKDPDKEGMRKEGILCALFKGIINNSGFHYFYLYECGQFEEEEAKVKESASITLREITQNTSKESKPTAIKVTALHNRRLEEYRAGTTLVQVAIELSMALNFEGGVEADNVLKISESFYEKIGFQKIPPARPSDLTYMKLPKEALEIWKKRIEAHRILPSKSQ